MQNTDAREARLCLESDKVHRFRSSRMAFVPIHFNAQEKTQVL